MEELLPHSCDPSSQLIRWGHTWHYILPKPAGRAADQQDGDGNQLINKNEGCDKYNLEISQTSPQTVFDAKIFAPNIFGTQKDFYTPENIWTKNLFRTKKILGPENF